MGFHLPVDVDRAALFAPMIEQVRYRGRWVARWQVDGPFRRQITRYSPVRFALVYLPHHLRSRDTGMRYSLARLHLDMAAHASRWAGTSDGSGANKTPSRLALVAPRYSAKSTWDLVICPLWALAHEHRRLVLGVGDSVEQIQPHLGTVRMELAGNELLRADYPELVPVRRAGAQDTTATVTGRGGATLAVRSIGSRMLGLKVGNDRPDVIVIDDPEPDGAGYTDRARRHRLETIRNTVLPMNPDAAVVMQGTVVRHGSIMHDVVVAAGGEPAADWIVEEGFVCRHYPAIETDPVTGQERSFWEQRYGLVWLQSQRHKHSYALNLDGRPPMPGGRHWTESSFRYGRRPVRELIMVIDPATTVTDDSDYTAFVVGGLADDGVVQIEYARAFRLTSTQIRERAAMLCRTNPRVRLVLLERNVAGDWARGVLEPIDLRSGQRTQLAPGVRVDTFVSSTSKDGRIATLLDDHESDHVRYADRDCARELVAQAQRWPEVEHDDLLDACAALVDRLLRPDGRTPR